jgi:hypothetical protein
MTTEVGEIDTVGAESTVTDAGVTGVVDPPVGPPTVPVSVTVTVNTQFVVVSLGEYGCAIAPEFTNPGQAPDAIDHV